MNILNLYTSLLVLGKVFFPLPGGGGDGFPSVMGGTSLFVKILNAIFAIVQAYAALNVAVAGVGMIMSDDANVAANYKTRAINAFFGFVGVAVIWLIFTKLFASGGDI